MLSSYVNCRYAGRFIPLVLAALILAGCTAGQQPAVPAADIQGPANQGSDYYLHQMQQSRDDSRTHWQILAIRALMAEGRYTDAGKQLQALPAQLSDVEHNEIRLLAAQLAVNQKQMPLARQQLSRLPLSALSAAQKNRYYRLVIVSADNQSPLETLRAYIALEPTLKGSEHQKNLDDTWLTLLKIPQDQVGQLPINADENILQGWLDLLGVYYQNLSHQDTLKNAVQDWQTRYPYNPAAKTLPAGLSQSLNLSTALTQTIALFLPLTGPGAVFSKAIEQGFEDARNGRLATERLPEQPQGDPALQTTPISPAENNPQSAASSPGAEQDDPQPNVSQLAGSAQANPATQIKVYDTHQHPVEQLLQQAQQDGATLVVGPLFKADVQKVITVPTSLNILALNEPEDLQNHPNVCYFALSPENEARNAAEHMWAQGKRAPILLLPGSNLGDRIATAFASQWQAQGGSTVLRQTMSSESDLRQQLNNQAGISLSGSPVAVADSSSENSPDVAGVNSTSPVSQPSPVTESREGMVDSVYIVASQADLELIKPMITLRTGSRSQIGFYASSLSSQAGAGPDFRLEMEGLQFSDIPLLSGANPALKQQITGQFNNDYTLTRLYALGIDAWTLANHFSRIRHQSDYQLKGTTGDLNTTQNCVINRTLSWNQYLQGEVVPVH